jgi:dTDP-4-dehydrorhamnose reductase
MEKIDPPPYNEEDIENPLNSYGKTKLLGEMAVKKNMSYSAIIIRTSWLYSKYRNNFIKTILKLHKENSSINIVDDQIGSPTYAGDLAELIVDIVHSFQYKKQPFKTQVYYYSNSGSCSWYDFAMHFFFLSNIECNIKPISTDEYNSATRRPKYSVMNTNKISKAFNINVPHWKDSLQKNILTINQ